MPRTKITKTKRNRDAAKEEREDLKMERLKNFDSALEQMEQKIISSHSEAIEDIISKTQSMKLKISKKILSMINFFYVDENTVNDLLRSDSVNSSKPSNASVLGAISSTMSCSSKKSNDEGYLTEDNVSTRGSNLLPLPSFPASLGRTPGPLSSAKAKARIRRSRSASGQVLNSAQKSKPISRTTSEHASRSKMRTPLLRQKAISADRAAVPATPNSKYSNSPVMLRWAKPHETIISLSGSPLVTPMMASSVANINIPTVNGMVSLRPKNIDPNELGQRIAESLCPESLAQIRQLQSHLNVIMSMAEKN